MDLEEVILLSSDDEVLFDSDQTPSDESNGRSRAFFDPDEILRALDESLDLEELLEGMDLSPRALSILAYHQVLSFSYLFFVITNDADPPLYRRHGYSIAPRGESCPSEPGCCDPGGCLLSTEFPLHPC